MRLKTTISQRKKNTLDEINGRFDIIEEKISELKAIVMETMQNETKEKGIKPTEKRIIWLWNNFKWSR